MTGLHLSQYRIDAELGRGGMGVVYRATDTKLNRKVALKVLPAAALGSDEDRARFFREAQAAAQLSHPNVCHVYQVDEAIPLNEDGKQVTGHSDRRLFIAMEYIEGETLGEHIANGPLKLTEAVNIAAQVAEALRAAHAKEIVHRDIKSANVMLTAEGVAKVLDFGLAKTTASTMLTRQGSTLGTVAYMSPEQARGEPVDGRTDLWSLGVVLYEMVAGRLPFSADYEQAALYAILNEAPEPLTAVRTGVDFELERIVDKLLEREADLRYASAESVAVDLRRWSNGTTMRSSSRMSAARHAAPSAVHPTGSAPVDAAPSVETPARRLPLVPLAGVVAGLVLGVLGAWLLLSAGGQPSVPTQRLEIDLSGYPGAQFPTLTQDASKMAFAAFDSVSGVRMAYVRDQATGEVQRVPNSEGARRPSFSPDGRWLLFGTEVDIRKVLTAGGSPVVLARAPFAMATWGPDGSVIYESDGPLRIIEEGANEPRILVAPDTARGEYFFDHPWTSPDGRDLLFTAVMADGSFKVGAMRLPDGEVEVLAEDASQARFAASGHLIYARGNSSQLMVRPYDLGARRALGEEVPIAEQSLNGLYAISENGVMVMIQGVMEVENPAMALLDRSGALLRQVDMPSEPRCCPDLTPDESSIVVAERNATTDLWRIWNYDTTTWSSRPISPADEYARWPVVRGESEVLYLGAGGSVVSRQYACSIWSTDLSGRTTSSPVVSGVACASGFALSGDGSSIVYQPSGSGQERSVVLRELDSAAERVIYRTTGRVGALALNEDASLVALSVRVTGPEQILVVETDGDGVWTAAEATSEVLRWSLSGDRLYFSELNEILHVSVTRGSGGLRIGTPIVTSSRPGIISGFVERPGSGGFYVTEEWDMVFSAASSTSRSRAMVVVGWFDELTRLAPPSE